MTQTAYPWKERLKIILIVWFYRLYYLFLRLKKDPLPDIVQQRRRNGEAVLYAHFHGDEISLVGLFAHRNITILTSLSRDGEFLSRILWRLGFQTIRGSSSRGGAQALRELAHAVKKGRDASIAVDGPRGPAYQVKRGIILLAKLTQAPIIPIAANPRHYRQLQKTWDKTEVPLPFTSVELCYGMPLFVPRDSKEEQMETLCHELQRRLHLLKKLPLA